MRIAIAQLRMHWTLADNLAAMRAALVDAAGQGAQLCLFGELALTGYHREIAREADLARVQQGLQQLQADCARLGITAAVGAPTWAEAGGKPFNSHLLIDAQGRPINQVDKDGLTLVETFFFQPGCGRPVARVGGLRCTSVLCREVEEAPLLNGQLVADPVDLVLWPSLAGMGAGSSYEGLVQALARHSAAWWLQCNAPNAPNTPELQGLGGSLVVSPQGETVLRLPLDEAGLAVFTLGERALEWRPELALPA